MDVFTVRHIVKGEKGEGNKFAKRKFVHVINFIGVIFQMLSSTRELKLERRQQKNLTTSLGSALIVQSHKLQSDVSPDLIS